MFAMSVAFAQQTRNPNAVKPKPIVSSNTEATLVTSVNESFEGTFPPTGWALYSPDGGTGWYQENVGTTPIPGWNGGVVTPTPGGTGGTKMAFCTWTTGGTASNDQWLVTPQISVTANYGMSFFVRKFGSYLDSLFILVSETSNTIPSFTATLNATGWSAADSGWYFKAFNLSAYSGKSIYIAFREKIADNQTNGAALFVDLVKVGAGVMGVENHNNVTFNIYPNPVKETMYLEANSNIQRVKISNLLGQVMEEFVVDGKKTQVNTSDYQPGVYFVTVETENGVSSRKINVSR